MSNRNPNTDDALNSIASDLPARIKVAYGVAKDQYNIDVRTLREIKDRHIRQPDDQTPVTLMALLVDLQTRWPDKDTVTGQLPEFLAPKTTPASPAPLEATEPPQDAPTASPPLAPEPSEPWATSEAFIAALTGAADTPIRLRFIHDSDRNKRAFEVGGTIRELWSTVEQRQLEGYGVFYVVNETSDQLDHSFANDKDVTAIRALFADHDDGLPETFHISPSMIVNTSAGKGQSIWTVPGMAVEDFKPAQQRIAARYHSDEAVCNRSRVLRLAGSQHLKNPNNPQLVTFEDYSELLPPRTAADILVGLAALPPPKHRSKSSGQPIAEKVLRDAAAHVDPFTGRAEWLNNCMALHAANIAGSEDSEAVAGVIAREWSAGLLDTGNRFKDTGAHYSGPDAVTTVLETTDVDGAITLGTFLHAAATGGWKGNPSDDGKAAAETFAGFAGKVEEQEKPLPNFLKTITDILAEADPEPLIEGFVMRGENICFFGTFKIGKSFVTLEMALCIATGLPVFGKLKVHRTGPVVYLSGEGHRGVKKRIVAWCQEHGIDPKSLKGKFFYKAGVPQAKDALAQAKGYIDCITAQLGRTPEFVVIDTMARSMPGMNENDSGDMGSYLAMTEELRNGLDCTIATVAHMGKDESKGIRGSTAAPAGFDGTYLVTGDKARKILKVESADMKDSGDLGPYCARLKPVTAAGMKYGDTMVPVFMSLEDYENDPKAKESSKEAAAVLARILVANNCHSCSIDNFGSQQLAEHWYDFQYGVPTEQPDEQAEDIRNIGIEKLRKRLINNSKGRSHGKTKSDAPGAFEHLCGEGRGSGQAKNELRWWVPHTQVIDLDEHRKAAE